MKKRMVEEEISVNHQGDLESPDWMDVPNSLRAQIRSYKTDNERIFIEQKKQ